MRQLANNPFCVWFGCGQMKTFKTGHAAQAFAATRRGRTGRFAPLRRLRPGGTLHGGRLGPLRRHGLAQMLR